jgi:hypothetical protein
MVCIKSVLLQVAECVTRRTLPIWQMLDTVVRNCSDFVMIFSGFLVHGQRTALAAQARYTGDEYPDGNDSEKRRVY